MRCGMMRAIHSSWMYMQIRHITATAPIRICDVGGWTDTWFAGHGSVCSLAVNPGVSVHIRVSPRQLSRQSIHLDVQNYGESLRYPDETARHPLLQAAIACNPIPEPFDAVITVHSEIPPGCSAGTSAAVSVALIGALRAVQGIRESPELLARAAHALETEELQQQSGIQDQIAAAYGGCVHITMTQYPTSQVRAISLRSETAKALHQQLLLYYIGKPHLSTHIHQQVIDRFVTLPDTHVLLEPLRRAADEAATALHTGDLQRYGAALQANTAAQRALHPALICAEAEHLIAIAQTYGAYGCKVNGAGGDGGSVAILMSSDADAQRACIATITAELPQMTRLPITLAPHGIQITESYE
ncbi:MAG: hypothetical protein RLY87_2551 [Chloroflexota bacterium]